MDKNVYPCQNGFDLLALWSQQAMEPQEALPSLLTFGRSQNVLSLSSTSDTTRAPANTSSLRRADHCPATPLL